MPLNPSSAFHNWRRYCYNGKEFEDEHGLNWYHYGARYYDPQLGRWHTADPSNQFYSPYLYGGNSPIVAIDQDGRVVETAWDVANIAVGGSSLGANLIAGNFLGVALDAGGLAYDIIATAVPGLPGGASTLIKLYRTTRIATWAERGFVRGQLIEKFLGRSIYSVSQGWTPIGSWNTGFYPVIDFFKGNTVVSLKTLDPTIKTLDRSVGKLIEHVYELATAKWPALGKNIDRVLDPRVPEGTSQHVIKKLQEQLTEAIPEGLEKKVRIIVSEF